MLGNKSKTELGHAADKKGISHSEHSERPVAMFITLHSSWFLLSPLLGQGPPDHASGGCSRLGAPGALLWEEGDGDWRKRHLEEVPRGEAE